MLCYVCVAVLRYRVAFRNGRFVVKCYRVEVVRGRGGGGGGAEAEVGRRQRHCGKGLGFRCGGAVEAGRGSYRAEGVDE